MDSSNNFEYLLNVYHNNPHPATKERMIWIERELEGMLIARKSGERLLKDSTFFFREVIHRMAELSAVDHYAPETDGILGVCVKLKADSRKPALMFRTLENHHANAHPIRPMLDNSGIDYSENGKVLWDLLHNDPDPGTRKKMMDLEVEFDRLLVSKREEVFMLAGPNSIFRHIIHRMAHHWLFDHRTETDDQQRLVVTVKPRFDSRRPGVLFRQLIQETQLSDEKPGPSSNISGRGLGTDLVEISKANHKSSEKLAVLEKGAGRKPNTTDGIPGQTVAPSYEQVIADLGLSEKSRAILVENHVITVADIDILSDDDVNALTLPVRDARVLKNYISEKRGRTGKPTQNLLQTNLLQTTVISSSLPQQHSREVPQEALEHGPISPSMMSFGRRLRLSEQTLNILMLNGFKEEEDLTFLTSGNIQLLKLLLKDAAVLNKFVLSSSSNGADLPPPYSDEGVRVQKLHSVTKEEARPQLRSQGSYKILLIGETGSGKSTLVNYLANFFLTGSFDELRIVIPTKYHEATEAIRHSEHDIGDGAVSKTSNCSVYRYTHEKATFEFIDTPGLSDTSGTKKDDENISKIMQAANDAGKLSAIIVVINGSVARKTATLANTIQRMKGSLPDVVLKNLIVVLTNSTRLSANFQLDTLKPWVIQEENVFFVDNSALSCDPLVWRGNVAFRSKVFEKWDKSMNEIQRMVARASELGESSTKAFKTMKEQQDMITAELVGTLMEIKNLHKVQDQLDAAEKAQTGVANDLKKYANYILTKIFKKTEVVNIAKLVDCEYHSTLCQKHSDKVICHEYCSLQETITVGDNIFQRCACMQGGTTCKVCECGFATHYHAKKKLVKTTETVEEILQDVKAKYDLSTNQQATLSKDILTFKSDMAALKAALARKEKTIETCCKQLQSICKEYNFVALMTTNISMMEANAQTIKSVEARQEADGMIRRIKTLVDRLKS